jgi:hypothetical protein
MLTAELVDLEGQAGIGERPAICNVQICGRSDARAPISLWEAAPDRC